VLQHKEGKSEGNPTGGLWVIIAGLFSAQKTHSEQKLMLSNDVRISASLNTPALYRKAGLIATNNYLCSLNAECLQLCIKPIKLLQKGH
jgi:hypothetical protein